MDLFNDLLSALQSAINWAISLPWHEWLNLALGYVLGMSRDTWAILLGALAPVIFIVYYRRVMRNDFTETNVVVLNGGKRSSRWLKKFTITLLLIVSTAGIALVLNQNPALVKWAQQQATDTLTAVKGFTAAEPTPFDGSVTTTPVPAGERYTGRVTKVIDGDTVDLKTDAGTIKLRLDAIDTPERAQSYGSEATKALSKKISRENVTVYVTTQDRYGRYIGRIFLGDRDINLEMVAVVVKYFL